MVKKSFEVSYFGQVNKNKEWALVQKVVHMQFKFRLKDVLM